MSKTIDQLPASATVTGAEEIPAWQNGGTVKLTTAAIIAALVGTSNSNSSSSSTPLTVGQIAALFATLPTTRPSIGPALWLNNGVLTLVYAASDDATLVSFGFNG